MSKKKIPPTEQEIREFMKTIPDHLKNLEYEDLKQLFGHYFKKFTYQNLDFSNTPNSFKQNRINGQNVVFRARPNDNSKNKIFKNVSEISFIPDSDIYNIKEFGRVNKPFEPMFYGSFDYRTACVETISKGEEYYIEPNTMITVGIWTFETPLNLVNIPHSEKYFNKFYENENYEYKEKQLKFIREKNDKIKNDIKNNFEFDKLMFFADEFAKFDTRENKEYMICNIFADRVFRKDCNCKKEKEVDGIIYPSTIFSYQENNIVLKPEVVTNKLKFYRAFQIRFENLVETENRSCFVKVGKEVEADENGNLLWN